MGCEGSGAKAANLNRCGDERRTGHFEPLARAKGRADRLVDGSGGGADGSDRRTRGQVGPAAEDARQFQRSAFEGSEGVGGFHAQGQGQSARRGASPAPSQPDLGADRVGFCLPGLRERCVECGAKSVRDLRSRRNPRHQTRRDARDAAGRRLPMLPQAVQGAPGKRAWSRDRRSGRTFAPS